jgi:hypothetical protein
MGLRRTCWFYFVVIFLLATTARADVVYRVAENPGAGQFDLNTDGITDFVFQHDSACFMSYPVHCVDFFNIRGPYLIPHRNGLIVDGQFAAGLTPETVIGDSRPRLSWVHGFDATLIPGVGIAFTDDNLPQSPDTIMLGIRFEAADGFHYGWMRIATQPWDPGPINVSPNGDEVIVVDRIIHGPGEVLDWAYESTPGAAIVAGAVPEAGTVVLGILAAAVMALVVLRRRHLKVCGLIAMFVVFVWAPLNARGEIIYRTNPDRDNQWIDVDTNGTTDVRFWTMHNITDCVGCPVMSYAQVDGFSSSGLLVDGFDAARLAGGTIVGALPPAETSWQIGFDTHSLSTYRDFFGWSGDWDHFGEGMIGVSFESEAGLHYGWIQLKLGSEFVPRELEPGIVGFIRPGPIVESWAYESTPGAPIVAGAVPEAGTVVLGVVGAVAMVMVVLRRRRVVRG